MRGRTAAGTKGQGKSAVSHAAERAETAAPAAARAAAGKKVPAVKICGMTRRADIECVNQLLPDYAGFVFAESSSRQVSCERARGLSAALDGRITAVGVFTEPAVDLMERLLAGGIIKAVQLHGFGSGALIDRLRKSGCDMIIQAFSVQSEDDIHRAEASAADMVLLDNGNGGTGNNFDWTMIKEMKRPFFLAGGLNPDNVGAAVSRYHPFAVDVSSGVETGGLKDPEKIKCFIDAVRGI